MKKFLLALMFLFSAPAYAEQEVVTIQEEDMYEELQENPAVTELLQQPKYSGKVQNIKVLTSQYKKHINQYEQYSTQYDDLKTQWQSGAAKESSQKVYQ